MPTCFVIQPFDAENDRRYKEVYKRALEQAGLTPYRVDEDPTAQVPIAAIEKNIRDSAICLADITSDNPNVWYELGYAFAVDRPVVMTCTKERMPNLPFDVHHRTVIEYATGSPSDFDRLRESIVERAKALVEHAERIQELADEQIAPHEGVSQVEVTVLAVSAANMAPGMASAKDVVQKDAERSGLTRTGFHVALRRLAKRQLIAPEEAEHRNELGEIWTEERVKLTDSGWDWIDGNASLFSFVKPRPAAIKDDDIPF